MSRFASALAAGAALILAAGPALAADPAGDWTGVLTTVNGKSNIGIQIRAAPGGYTGVYNDWTHDAWRVPLTPTRGARPPYRINNLIHGSFEFRWDAHAGRWIGVWRESTGVYFMTFQRGVIPPAPLFTRGDKLALIITVGLMLVEAAVIARFLQLRRRRRLRASLA